MTDVQPQEHKAVQLTAESFDSTISNEKHLPVMVDFYADWCGPCQIAAPIIERLAGEFEGRVIVAKLDVDDHNEIARKYGVQSIPTVLTFKNGEVVDKQIGFLGENKYRDMLTKVIG